MSNQLQENLNLILEEKNTKLLPENLKAGVICLGVTGTLENNNGLITEEEYNTLLASASSILYDDIYREPLVFTYDSGMLESITFDPNISKIIDISYGNVGTDSCLFRGTDKITGVEDTGIYIYTYASFTDTYAKYVETYNGVEIRFADVGNAAWGWYKDNLYWYVYVSDSGTIESVRRYIDGISVVARKTASDGGSWSGEREDEGLGSDNELPLG